MKILNLTRERKSEGWSSSDFLLAEDYVKNPEEALREAVKDFMSSKDGKVIVGHSCGDFNWGDLINVITDEILEVHGLYRCNRDIFNITVSETEVLYPDIQNEILKVSYE